MGWQASEGGASLGARWRFLTASAFGLTEPLSALLQVFLQELAIHCPVSRRHAVAARVHRIPDLAVEAGPRRRPNGRLQPRLAEQPIDRRTFMRWADANKLALMARVL